MENEILQNTPPVQPLPQTPPIVPSSTNWSKILPFIALGFVIVASSVFIGIQIGKNRTPAPEPIINQPVVTPTEFPVQTISPTEPNPVTDTVKPISVPTAKITPLNIEDWKQVQNNGVFFKIPANATCNSDIECTEVTYPNVYQGKTLPLPARILVKVTDYLGGSRRTQYLASYKEVQDCKPIYVETKFGSVNALQIAIDGGWCQGGYDGGIVAVIGKKFVILGPGLNYNENKEISRWAERDTLVSTLSSK